MNIVDSSCWIEYLMGTEIGSKIAPVIENPDELIVPTIILYEVFKKLLAEKNEEYALNVVSYMQSGKIIELDTNLSLAAVHASRKYKLPMADSIILATSLHFSAVIFSCDKHFKDFPGIQFFPKDQ